ncbi:MAG: carboxymuconolactone decarboxylase family protein [Pikeienuella sp.]
MDWTVYLDETSGELATLRREIPETAAAFSALAKSATLPGVLDTRTKELIALGIGIAVRCEACIGFHVRAAARAGARREEITETIAMGVYMGGGPSLMYGAKTLAAWDSLTDQARP